MDDRYLSPSEVAKRFGLSIKALRHYESCGLLAPKRTSNGSTGSAWRVYGPDQVARLHQILALKRLGLTLARIGEILAGPDRLAEVLALQEQALVGQGAQLAHALALVRAAQAKLKSGQALSIDDLTTLNQETVMKPIPDPEKLASVVLPVYTEFLSLEERSDIRERAKNIDMAQFRADMLKIRDEFRSLRDRGEEPTSPAVQAVARRQRGAMDRLTGGDAQKLERMRAISRKVRAIPGIGKLLPHTDLDPVLDGFIRKALDHSIAAEGKTK